MVPRKPVEHRHGLQRELYTPCDSASSLVRSRDSVVPTLYSFADESLSEKPLGTRMSNSRSLPSPLDHIDPQRWKHFPRFSTTSNFASFPFPEIDVSDEEARLSADKRSTVGSTSSARENEKDLASMPQSAGTAFRGAAAGIRRAVSDSSNKIRQMTLRLRRAPSSLLNRSRSRAYKDSSLDTELRHKQDFAYPNAEAPCNKFIRHHQKGTEESEECKVGTQDVGAVEETKTTPIVVGDTEENGERASGVALVVSHLLNIDRII